MRRRKKTEKDIQQLEEILCDRLREAHCQWYEVNKNHLPSPRSLDLSFLNLSDPLSGQSVQDNVERPVRLRDDIDHRILSHRKAKSGIKRRSCRLLNTAAALILVFLLSGIMTVWINTNAAHALKFRIDKLFYETTDAHYATEGAQKNKEKNAMTLKITKADDLGILKRQIPELMLPQTLPEGFSFDSADAERWENGEWHATLNYMNKEGGVLSINEACCKEEAMIDIPIRAESVYASGRTFFYLEESEVSHGIYYIEDNTSIQISGCLRKEDLLDFAEDIIRSNS